MLIAANQNEIEVPECATALHRQRHLPKLIFYTFGKNYKEENEGVSMISSTM